MAASAAGGRLAAATLIGVAAGALGLGSPASSAERSNGLPADARVEVATTGHGSELVRTLPITRRRGARPRVVISLGPPKLPDLAPGDRLRISAELQVTGDCPKPLPRCVGRPYEYAPKARARLLLAASPRASGGSGTVALGRIEREQCTQRHPQYEHHCVLVFRDVARSIGSRRPPPCPLERCFINLVADAHHPRARAGDLLMVGGLKPDGRVPQDRGRINAVRYRGAPPSAYSPTSTSRLTSGSMRPDFRRRVVISKRLDGLRSGAQLAVAAEMRTEISHLPYAVRTSARLILAERPRATRPSEWVKARASLAGEIAENNGSNCTQDERRCTSRKVGVLEIRGDAVRAGRPRPMFVNLVTVLGPKAPKARAGDRIRLLRGEIEVVRFPSRVRG